MRFSGDAPDEPLINSLIKKFDIEVNIFGGGIQKIQDAKVGVLNADISGNDLENAIAFLKDNGVAVEKSGV